MTTIIKGRIRVYTSVRHNLELAKKIYEKHSSDGDTSLLGSMEDFSWDVTGPKINFCQEKHKEALSLSKKAEEVYRQRDAALAEITDIINMSKSILQMKYIECPEKMKDWGFPSGDHADRAHKTPT